MLAPGAGAVGTPLCPRPGGVFLSPPPIHLGTLALVCSAGISRVYGFSGGLLVPEAVTARVYQLLARARGAEGFRQGLLSTYCVSGLC